MLSFRGTKDMDIYIYDPLEATPWVYMTSITLDDPRGTGCATPEVTVPINRY